MSDQTAAHPLLLVVDDDPSSLLQIDVPAERLGVVALSTEAVLDECGPQLEADGTLIKPLTRHSLAACLERYLPARSE